MKLFIVFIIALELNSCSNYISLNYFFGMGQSSNKQIHSNKNPPTQSELQLENVDERRRLVEIRSQDVSTNVIFLFVQIHEPNTKQPNWFQWFHWSNLKEYCSKHMDNFK